MADAIAFPGANFLFKGDGETIGDLATFRQPNGPANVSCWRLRSEELRDANRTGCVFLSVMSNRIFFPAIVGSEDTVRSVVADLGQVWERGDPGAPARRRFEAVETAQGWAVLHKPVPFKHEDGLTTLKLAMPILIVSEHIDDRAGVAQRLADILEANWDAANG